MATFEGSIGTILANEGGYVDNPSDPGGATNYGISLRTLIKEHIDVNLDGVVNKDDIVLMSKEVAEDIYRADYWFFSDLLSQDVATKLFDIAVCMGPTTAVEFAQQACQTLGKQITVDKKWGPKTVATLNGSEDSPLLAELRTEMSHRFTHLVAINPKLWQFLKGWLRRAAQ